MLFFFSSYLVSQAFCFSMNAYLQVCTVSCAQQHMTKMLKGTHVLLYDLLHTYSEIATRGVDATAVCTFFSGELSSIAAFSFSEEFKKNRLNFEIAPYSLCKGPACFILYLCRLLYDVKYTSGFTLLHLL